MFLTIHGSIVRMFKTTKAVRDAADAATRAIERAESVADDIPQGIIVGLTFAAVVLAGLALIVSVARR